MHHPFFQQHIPRFIAASYKEEHLNRDKNSNYLEILISIKICKSLRKEYHMQIQPFQKQKKNLSNFSLQADRTISKSDAS